MDPEQEPPTIAPYLLHILDSDQDELAPFHEPIEDEVIVQQCRQVKKQLNAVEKLNDSLQLRVTRVRQVIKRLLLEHAMLLAYLNQPDEPVDEDEEEEAAMDDKEQDKDGDMENVEANDDETQHFGGGQVHQGKCLMTDGLQNGGRQESRFVDADQDIVLLTPGGECKDMWIE